MSKIKYCVDKELKIIVEVYPEETDLDSDNPMFFFTDSEEEALSKLIHILENNLEYYKYCFRLCKNKETT